MSTTPQQPEMHRSGRGEVDPDAAKTRRGGRSDEEGNPGPVPEANRPGHHPEQDQDKPSPDRLSAAREEEPPPER